MSSTFNEKHRFGSAGWASEDDLRAAGLFNRAGPQIGYWNKTPIHLDGDAPMITIGGAGSGKLRDLLSYVLCNAPGVPMIVLDPRGELAAISLHNLVRDDELGYCWNPIALCGNPQHGCNPLDILSPDAPDFHANVAFITEGLIALRGGEGQYFCMRAREWTGALMKSRVEKNGRTSLPDLYRTINAIESDRNAWADQLEAMLASRFDDVRRVAGEMLTKQQDAPKEFGGIMGEIYGCFAFLNDPVLLTWLEESEFSLAALVDQSRVSKIFLNIPAEYLSVWSPLVRLFFTVAMLYKSRNPGGRRVMLLVDEAGQLGRFDALVRAYTYGRGAGVRAWSIWQDAGQIVRNLGSTALQGLLGSSQMRQFFGVRDYDTARLVSSMLGTETLEYDDTLQQDAAKRQKYETVRRVMSGGDPFEAAYDYAHFNRNAEHRTKQARALMTPDEILAMPEDRQILFISGKNLKPILAWKYPYYTRREMAGRYLPNPYHPPMDYVPIPGMFGTKRVPVITENVPPRLAALPQYKGGQWSYVKGHRPV
jgi:type IV secretion system protein VirD4